MRSKVVFSKADDYTLPKYGRALGIYPYYRELISAQDTEVALPNGNKVIMLGSNCYLGLTTHPKVKEAAIEAIKKYGTGCSGSRLLNGTLDLHIKLEKELADFLGKEECIMYSTGFLANLGVMPAMMRRKDYIIMDELNHASLYEGSKLALCEVVRFNHNDMDDLEAKLKGLPEEAGKMIVVDGVYSMEGDIANLPKIVELSTKYSSVLLVDDAHGVGVLGKDGRGTCDHFGLTKKADFIMGTFSKSFASIGGYIASDHRTIDFLKHHSRSLIFSASLPPASTAAAQAALSIMKSEPERRERLWHNTKLIKEGLNSLGFKTGISTTPIIPVYLSEMEKVVRFTRKLLDNGVFVNPVLPPAVPPNHCILRVSLMATHTDDQIERALAAFKRIGTKMGFI
ncbi:MAG TPA: 8-amino-7-oxononanoate synthase [Lentisphaeria bacterium]|nr:MAG: 8-amino-7-oxononanoate synthase [Lentisphaerae bacterium GWF2_38_69]HBM14749.1 8-amino-7-oxononanoate synthase [Lentisphaeria bacterium]